MRNRSWPAVSHCVVSAYQRFGRRAACGVRRTICSLTVLPSSSMVRIFCARLASRMLTGSHADGQTHKINADGGDVALRVCVIGKAQQQAGLADTRVTDEEEFEEVVVSAEGQPGRP